MVKIIGRIGFAIVILLALVGINSVVRRAILTTQFLADPTTLDQSLADLQGSPLSADFEIRYYDHPYLTLVHIVTGFLFMTLGPLQFVEAIRNRWLNFHRWCGRVFLIASLVGVGSAVAFVPMLPVYGSFATRVGVVVAASYFLVSLVQGYRHIRRRQIAQHREWMIRMFAVGLGISTFRLLLPPLMMPPLSATFPEAWDTAVWLGFVMNAAVAEVWVNVTRPRPAGRHVSISVDAEISPASASLDPAVSLVK
jgi:uncharacterized membrane protein